MKHLIHCVKLNKEAEGLSVPPLPGEFGQKIYEHISQEAWQMWLEKQTMLINEQRLSMVDPKARSFLLAEMEHFLFNSK
jgi:Fe-S cluster biosynthesis and repair protein YggX